MLAALFLNSGFLFVAGALVSVPIIIHLINRMRFKRIRWAAMEFLLKAQKRTRRRLIIEQLLLLALRCLLIALVGLLVARFVGCGDSNIAGKPNLHIVLLDDTLSMQDRWVTGESSKSCFDVAKDDVIINTIAKGLSISKTNDKLVVIPLSKCDETDHTIYDQLNGSESLEKLKTDVKKLQPTILHVPVSKGLKAVQKFIEDNPDSAATLHIVGDFRQNDSGAPPGAVVHKELLDLIKNHPEVKIRLIDTVHPPRSAEVAGYAAARDNVGIIDLRPSATLTAKGREIVFTTAIKNFSTTKEFKVGLDVYNETTGKRVADVDFTTPTPISLPPSTVSYINFRRILDPDSKDTWDFAHLPNFAHLSVRLAGISKADKDGGEGSKDNDNKKADDNAQVESDALSADNIRYTAVEVRDKVKVPILIVDGEGARGRAKKKDSFHIAHALFAVSGQSYSYDVNFGDLLPEAGGSAVKAIERADLSRFATIFLLNVNSFTPEQLTKLEHYVKEGGSLAFFLGENVNVEFYNEILFKDGKGIFPVPLNAYKPDKNQPEMEPKLDGTPRLLIREEKFSKDNVPIFSPLFKSSPQQKEQLNGLPIRRYFPVDRSKWKPEPGKVHELATLPNDADIAFYRTRVLKLVDENDDNIKTIVANADLASYQDRVQKYFNELREAVEPGRKKKLHDLATVIDLFLKDKGDERAKTPIANLTKFWLNSDPSVQKLREKLINLREEVLYGDPYIILSNYEKGRVVAVMSTAGRDWNDWGAGSDASVLYPPFILEMQQYLSSPGSDTNLTVGTDQEVALNAAQYANTQLKMVRYYVKPQLNGNAEKKQTGEQFGKEEGSAIRFHLSKHFEPGLYLSEVFTEKDGRKTPVATYAHVFNVDTIREGPLQRARSEELTTELVTKSNGAIKMVEAGSSPELLVGKQHDFSESPWLFLLFLLILVAEQALAVHLSFHLKNNEELSPGARTDAHVA